jgi:hypothetical protein
MLETDRTTTLDPQARLAVLLATTGLTQLDLAKLLGVASRTVRRWMQGVCTPPAVAIKAGRTSSSSPTTATPTGTGSGPDPTLRQCGTPGQPRA